MILPTFVTKHWLSIAFLGGFVTDFLLLNKVDDKIDNLILLIYVLLASISLILFYVGVAEKMGVRLSSYLTHFMPLLMQYSFGGLLSGMLIFYGRSGDLLSNAPYLILILSVIGANELIKKRSDRLIYNLAVYFIGLFSYLVLVVPVWLGEMGDIVFFGSGFFALLIMWLVGKGIEKQVPNFMALQKKSLIFIIGSLYALLNGLYFFNLIPPIPLSLSTLGLYQNVEKTAQGSYRLIGEEPSGWQSYIPFWEIPFHPTAGQGVYCFARVYAPTDLSTEIVHRWEYRDASGDWVEHFKTSYRISGENKNGYGGYTNIKSIHDGVWRCSVETVRGQVLGRETFRVDQSRSPKNLVTVLK